MEKKSASVVITNTHADILWGQKHAAEHLPDIDLAVALTQVLAAQAPEEQSVYLEMRLPERQLQAVARGQLVCLDLSTPRLTRTRLERFSERALERAQQKVAQR